MLSAAGAVLLSVEVDDEPCELSGVVVEGLLEEHAASERTITAERSSAINFFINLLLNIMLKNNKTNYSKIITKRFQKRNRNLDKKIRDKLKKIVKFAMKQTCSRILEMVELMRIVTNKMNGESNG